MEKVYIYTLSSSENPEDIKYVGQTKYIKKRLKQHKNTKRSPTTLKTNWIKSVVNKGFDIIINIIEETTEKDFAEREKYWIKHYKDLGYSLKNMTDGGETIYAKGETHHLYNKIGKNSYLFKGKNYSNFSKKSKRRGKNKKPVDMVNIETGIILKTFPSASEAALYLKGNPNNIATICRYYLNEAKGIVNKKSTKTYQGYKWQYSNKIYYPLKQFKDDVLINEYKSLNEAGEKTGIKTSLICKAYLGQQKTAGGYKWVFTYDNTGTPLHF